MWDWDSVSISYKSSLISVCERYAAGSYNKNICLYEEGTRGLKRCHTEKPRPDEDDAFFWCRKSCWPTCTQRDWWGLPAPVSSVTWECKRNQRVKVYDNDRMDTSKVFAQNFILICLSMFRQSSSHAGSTRRWGAWRNWRYALRKQPSIKSMPSTQPFGPLLVDIFRHSDFALFKCLF